MMEELVPDGQRKSQVGVLGAVQLVVDAVVVRAHENPAQRAEPEIRVGVLKGDEPGIGDEHCERHGAIGQENDSRDQCEEIRDMDQRMRAKDGEHAHVLLRMVKLMKAPEHSNAVIRKMREPIAPVHRHKDHGDDGPTGNESEPRHDDPREVPLSDTGKGQ